ncbi:hypothetical protein [Streptomyces griseorubiginosus]|uniref:hypothetical protein n=1 Tax=Streptomyces griseorubiginosus TaxID=67304 RepID=UPI003322E5F0
MTSRVENQGLFRVYAITWFAFAATAFSLVYAAVDVPASAVVTYAAIGVGLWLVNMVLTKGGPQGHALSHAVLAAAFAAVWPLVVVALAVYLGSAVVQGLRH